MKRSLRFEAGLLILCALSVQACGGGGGGVGTPDDGGEADTDAGGQVDADGDDGSGADTGDDTGSVDTGDDAFDGSGGGLPVGELCLGDRECSTALCFRFDASIDEGFCSAYCNTTDDCPPDGFECIFLANSGGDFAKVCVPDDLCIDRDDDGFGVGPSCEGPDCDDADALAFLGADELCDDIDNDCDGNIDDNVVDVNTVCSTGFPGVCSTGRLFCQEGLASCEPDRVATAEICDGLDNDCDGQVDNNADGAPLTSECYGGPTATLGVGACVGGLRMCVDGGISDCIGQVLPFPETCDGVDNDCDGETDEGSIGGGVPCDVPGALGVCARGTTVCDASGAQICEPQGTATAEVCDGLDNDCDGAIDEGDDGGSLTRTCYGGPDETRGVGECSDGVSTCADGDFGPCVGDSLPIPELCNGWDDDCNGVADDETTSGGFVCATGLPGACALGQTICGADGSECVPSVEPTDEICDGVDNDCDGLTDEGDDGAPLWRACYGGTPGTAGVGLCAEGVQTCGVDGFGLCVGEQRPTLETCDGLDNDCDGAADEGNPEAGATCSTGLPGACGIGVSACTDGTLVCEGDVAPGTVAEICDGIDNDCDGARDEDADGSVLERSCYGGPTGTAGVGVCIGGTQVCSTDGFGLCEGEVRPSLEICDGLDNDCDGSIDEGNPGGNVSCSTGLDGVCGAGLTVCTDGELACTGSVAPGTQTEACDGLDNDCDGATDEAADGGVLTRSCYGGAAGTAGVGACAAGVQTCGGASGFGACEGEVRPGFEICDGDDNDCDGATDEGNPGGGVSCSTGFVGECAAGATVCSGGAVVCEAAAEPGENAEVCDGRDNDCDGTVDDGYPGVGTPCFEGLGNCRRAGVTVCDPLSNTNLPVCDATPGTPSPFEACDYTDDDCDGTVDDGFVNASGRYNQVANCGGCGIDCDNLWPGGAELYNVAPVCLTSGASFRCDFDCLPGYIDADGVQENGCEFLPEPTTLYVATPSSGGVDGATCGAWNAPCATIGRALSRAAAPGSGFDRVRVSTGVYRENVTLVNGVSLLGGHNPDNWDRNNGINVTVITGSTPTPTSADRVTITAANITAPTEFSGFTVNGENAAAGGNSVAIYITDSTNALLVSDNRIFAGNGGLGTAGTVGNNGNAGNNGANGLDRTIQTCATNTLAGGAGGTRSCGGSIAGGTGGASLWSATRFTANGAGTSGNGPTPGAGGAGGESMAYDGSTCYVDGTTFGSDGLRGADGTDGAGGAGAASAAGTVTTGQWRGNAGGTGTAGVRGSGGGGGGASGGVTPYFASSGTTCYTGATGGGGGSGGCAGTAGTGGGAGGGSFAIFVNFTTAPASAAVSPRIVVNQIARGTGGNGGAGGNGGGGGAGGEGGAGGRVPGGSPYDFCLSEGGSGGLGGRGGHGGGGGGGAGGASYDIYVNNTDGRNADYSSNTFEVAAGVNTAGAGGPGGTSLNTATGPGSAGAVGVFGQVANIN